jgi:hypothetical protein
MKLRFSYGQFSGALNKKSRHHRAAARFLQDGTKDEPPSQAINDEIRRHNMAADSYIEVSNSVVCDNGSIELTLEEAMLFGLVEFGVWS